MSYTEDITNGASILKQVDVTDIITTLALGIANAQEKLDNNSISQLAKLTETEVAGKSLLELGFYPAFYAFDYADISASINLKMALKKSDELDVSVQAEYLKGKGFTQEKIDDLQRNQNDLIKDKFEGSRSFNMTSETVSSVKIKENTVNLNTEDGSISKVEKNAENIRSSQAVDRVVTNVQTKHKYIEDKSATNAELNVHNHRGYGLISMAEVSNKDWGIIRVHNYNNNTVVNINGSNYITLTGTLTDLTPESATTVDTLILKIAKSLVLPIYFDFDKYEKIDLDYGKNTTDFDLKEKLKTIALILKHDSNTKIDVIGHTDSMASDGYNIKLGQRRADTVKAYLACLGKSETTGIENQITSKSEGETKSRESSGPDEIENADFRKVEITLKFACDYIFIKGGSFNPDDSSSDTIIADASINSNGILYKKEASATNTKFDLKFGYNSANYISNSSSANKISSLNDLKTEAVYEDKFHSEIIGDVAYLLNKKEEVNYAAFSKSEKVIEITEDNTTNSEETINTNSLKIFESVNKETLLKKETKNLKSDSHFAISGSVDYRMARQFEMSVEGNAAVSARLKSLPAPQRFKDYIDQINNIGEQ